MRILMLGWEFPPHITGGLGTACQGITRGLTEHGVDVLLVLPCEHGDEERGSTRVIGCNRLEERADEDGAYEPSLELLAIDSSLRPYVGRAEYARRRAEFATSEAGEPASPPPFTGGYGANLEDEVERYARLVTDVAREESCDLIHAHDWMTFPAGLLARRETGKPLVCHLHSSEHDRRGDAADPVICAIEQRGLTGADRVVFVSQYAARVVADRYRVDPARARVVHNGVTADASRTPRPARLLGEHPVVLFLGRVTDQKGPDRFLEAAALVHEELPDARFVIAGDGDRLTATIERAASLGLARCVRFTGFLRGEEVAVVLAHADVYAMPSRSEPFGISALEAAAAGVPVVVSRQSGAAEALRSRRVVDFWDVEGLAREILDLLRTPTERQRLVDDGLAELEQHDWKHRAGDLLGVYEELIA